MNASPSDPSPLPPGSVTLLDGTGVLLRPVTPRDKERVRQAFQRLSEETRFHRFFTPLNALDDTLLEKLTTADGVNHVVWSALDAHDPDDPGLGAASFWRDPGNPSQAELSITVADEHQGQGVGTLLLALLWLLARSVGIHTFCLVALSDNVQVIRWMRDLGAAVDYRGGLCYLALELSENPERQLPCTAAADQLIHWLGLLPGVLDSIFPQ